MSILNIRSGLRVWIFMFLAGVISACSTSSNPVQLSSLELQPQDATVVVGESISLALTAQYSDGTTQDVTNSASWVSNFTHIAEVDAGIVTGVSSGVASIAASFGSLQISTTITVTPAALTRIEVAPTSAIIANGTQKAFQATAVYENNTTGDITDLVSWTSTNNSVATVSNLAGSRGLASSVAPGSTTIRATYQGLSSDAALTVTSAVAVSLAIDPVNASTALNRKRQFTATATLSDNTTQDVTDAAVWSSSDATVATINDPANPGEATPLKEDSVDITATFQNQTDTTSLTIGPAIALDRIEVTPASKSIPLGTTQDFTATAVYVDTGTEDVTALAQWTSSNPAIASVSNSQGSEGRATGLQVNAPNTVTIQASFESKTADAALTVTAAVLESIAISPAAPAAPVGSNLQFTATGTYSDNSQLDITDTVVWSSSTTSVATISVATGSEGLASLNNVGQTAITAESGDIQGQTALTVTSATLQSIVLEPANAKLPQEYARQYTATGIYSDNSRQNVTNTATWSVTDTNLASVSNSGNRGFVRATQNGPGDLLVRATIGQVSGQTGLEVTTATLNSIDVTPDGETLPLGDKLQYTATGNFSDTSNLDLTRQVDWASDNTNLITVSTTGLVAVANDKGAEALPKLVNITAQDLVKPSVTGTEPISVVDAEVTKLVVSPATASIAKGRTKDFKAFADFSDGRTNQDVTLSANLTWSSDTPATASIDANTGQATGVAAGSAVITASYDNTGSGTTVSDTADLTVTAAVLESIAISGTDADDSIAKGQDNQYEATATYSDTSTADITVDATWQSSNSGIATISNASSTEGLATGQLAGTTNITASLDGVTSPSLLLTVTAAVLDSLVITPDSADIPVGGTLQYSVEGTYSDNSKANLTTTVTWSSDDTNVASISNAASSQGLAYGKAEGNATVSASLNGKTDTAALTISPATVQNVTVSSPSGTTTVAPTGNLQLRADADYSDSSTKDVTASSEGTAWSSFDDTIATVSANGQVTGITPGQVTILAENGGKTDTIVITVTTP